MVKIADPVLTPAEWVERWKAWLKETENEMFRLYWSKATFDYIQRMYRTNEALRRVGIINYDWLLRLFVSDSLISIRREVEKGGGSKNLMNVLFEVERHSEAVLTRRYYVALYGESRVQVAVGNEHFNDKTGAMCPFPKATLPDDCISSDSVRRQREHLEARTKDACEYATAFIAHRLPRKPSDVALKTIHDAFDVIFETFEFFHTLLTGAVFAERVAIPQFDWLAPYRMPWITAEFDASVRAEQEERRRATSRGVVDAIKTRGGSLHDPGDTR